MTLAEQAKQHARRGGTPCGVGHLLHVADPAFAAELADALADDTVTSGGLALALKDAGYTVREHTIGRHRREACACGR